MHIRHGIQSQYVVTSEKFTNFDRGWTMPSDIFTFV